MADDGLRALERRYRDTGAVDDHARWIAARVRVGELSEHRARLAADLGHAAARLAMGEPPAVALGAVVGSLHGVCRATRAPAAHAEARWILTGEAAPTPTFTEAPLEVDEVNVRVAAAAARVARAGEPLEGEWLRCLERIDAWIRQPAGPLDVDQWTPFLSREDVLAAVLPESREAVGGYLGTLETTWRENQAAGDAGPWPGIDLWWVYRFHMYEIDERSAADAAAVELDDGEDDLDDLDDLDDFRYVNPELQLVRELARSRRGTVMLACCAALHATSYESGYAVKGAVDAAVRGLGEATVRGAIVREFVPWLLREGPGWAH